MKKENRQLAIDQIDNALKRFTPLKETNPPLKGWVRAIRDALGISTRQLGDKLGVSKSRVSRIERDEVAENVTLKTLRRVADAFDCVFVYGFVPRKSLKDSLRDQAIKVVRRRMTRVAHTMALEDQSLSEKEQNRAFEAAVDELLRSMPRSLWEVDK